MNANRRKQVVLLLIVIFVAALLTAVTGGEVVHAKKSPPVLPPDGTWYGKTYGEWGAEWWKWALALPADENHPLITDGEIDCSLGQDPEGDVWFLGGIFGVVPSSEDPTVIRGKAHRECDVPAGKALYFPIVNIICSPPAGDGSTEEELLGCANFVIDEFVFPKKAKIDRWQLRNLEDYRTVSSPFYIDEFADPNVLGVDPESIDPESDGIAVTSGYYVLVPPLSEGKHNIKFKAKTEVEGYYLFTLDIYYKLNVVDD